MKKKIKSKKSSPGKKKVITKKKTGGRGPSKNSKAKKILRIKAALRKLRLVKLKRKRKRR